MPIKITTQIAIEQFKLVHADKYDYSKVKYIDGKTKVTVVCKRKGHDEFEITPENHKQGTGCPVCGHEKRVAAGRSTRSSQSSIIRRFVEVHGLGTYDYSKVVFQRTDQKVVIICPLNDHGEFEQRVSHHLEGKGCPACGKELVKKDLKGKRIGKLTVIRFASEAEKSKNNLRGAATYWWVRCACGRDPFMLPSSLITSEKYAQKACLICSKRQMGINKTNENFDSIKGDEFGLLTVFRQWGTNKGGDLKVLCLCSGATGTRNCNGQVITTAAKVKTGHTKSCGCLDKGDDSYQSFARNRSHAEKDCFVYFADMGDNLIKVGITSNPEVRLVQLNAKRYFIDPVLLKRAEAWSIEQIILKESRFAAPNPIPAKHALLPGQFEIRTLAVMPLSFYLERFDFFA